MVIWLAPLRLCFAAIVLVGFLGQAQAQLPPDERRQMRQEMRQHWQQLPPRSGSEFVRNAMKDARLFSRCRRKTAVACARNCVISVMAGVKLDWKIVALDADPAARTQPAFSRSGAQGVASEKTEWLKNAFITRRDLTLR